VSAVAASAVRQWVATALEAMGGGYAFRESGLVLGVTEEASSIAHQAFSVVLDGERDLGQMRQRPGGGTRVRQVVTVRFAWRLRPNRNDQLVDYDAALDAAHAVARHLIQRPTATAAIHVMYSGISNRIAMDGGKWLMTDVDFEIDHHLSLAAVA